MADREPIDNEDLINTILQEQTIAYGYLTGDLSRDRARALDYYYGRPFGNEVPDRSQAMLLDVADTIEWIMPAIMKVFTAGDEVVAFRAVGAEDEEAAAQETAVINHVVLQDNNAFQVIYTWAKDGLLQKNGYVKVAWVENEETADENYIGLLPEEFAAIEQAGRDVKAKITSTINEEGLIDATVRVTGKTERVSILPVPPEEMLVSVQTDSTDLQETLFVQHRSRKTLSDIRLLGYEVDDDLPDTDDDLIFGEEWIARRQYEEQWQTEYSARSHKSMRSVMLRETYIRIDQDGDGIAELRRVVHVHNKILDKKKGGRPANDVVSTVPFACWSPIPAPHEHVGRSYADLVMDLQYIKVALLRQTLDNMYIVNNARTAINQNTVNLDDLLITRPGGVVRVNGNPGAEIMSMPAAGLGTAPVQLIEYLDTVKENRTGVTRYNQGLDANSLNKTATGISLITQSANQRLELIVRILAETGMRTLFRLVHELLRKNSTRALAIKLRGKYIAVDPRQWQTRTDLRIAVGLGTGNKDQMLMHLQSIMAVQKEILAGGGANLVSATNIYNSAKRMVENSGFKEVDEFFSDPDSEEQAQAAPAPGPSPDEMKVQAEMQVREGELDIRRGELDIKRGELDIKQLEARGALDTENAARIAESSIQQITAFMSAMQEMTVAIQSANNTLTQALIAPKVVERDPSGRISGWRTAL